MLDCCEWVFSMTFTIHFLCNGRGSLTVNKFFIILYPLSFPYHYSTALHWSTTAQHLSVHFSIPSIGGIPCDVKIVYHVFCGSQLADWPISQWLDSSVLHIIIHFVMPSSAIIKDTANLWLLILLFKESKINGYSSCTCSFAVVAVLVKKKTKKNAVFNCLS